LLRDAIVAVPLLTLLVLIVAFGAEVGWLMAQSPAEGRRL
jgi:hypothetical protein